MQGTVWPWLKNIGSIGTWARIDVALHSSHMAVQDSLKNPSLFYSLAGLAHNLLLRSPTSSKALMLAACRKAEIWLWTRNLWACCMAVIHSRHLSKPEMRLHRLVCKSAWNTGNASQQHLLECPGRCTPTIRECPVLNSTSPFCSILLYVSTLVYGHVEQWFTISGLRLKLKTSNQFASLQCGC